MPKTLFLYIAKHNVKWITYCFLGLSILAFLINCIEQTRRALARTKLHFLFELKLTLLQLPNFMELLLPFAVIFGGMISISFLNRHHEIIIARASGLSLRQLVIPSIFVAFLFGLFSILLLNPIVSHFKKQHTYLVNTYIKGKDPSIELSTNGFWLQSGLDDGYQIIHATQLTPPSITLIPVFFLEFNKEHKLQRRIDGLSAELKESKWVINHAWITSWDSQQKSIYYPSLELDTKLSPKKILNALAPAESLPIWKLQEFIHKFKSQGFPTRDHELQLHGLLSTPFFFASLIIFAALFSIHIPRFGTNFWGIIIGIGFGFFIYILDRIFFSLGTSTSLPVLLATWTPSIVTSLLGFAGLIQKEEG